MTYGVLISEAKQQLHRLLTSQVTLPTANDALVVCEARARLYRVVAGGIAHHLHPAVTDDPTPARQHGAGGIKLREATLLAHLRTDLLRSAATATGNAPTPTHPAGIVARLIRTGDLAGAAFDLLAGHLHPDRAQRVTGDSPLSPDGVRATARDAAQLARALTQLDRRLELPIRSAAGGHLDSTSQRRLVTIADDCHRVTEDGLPELAAAIHSVLRAPARQAVDDLDIAASDTMLRTPSTKPSAAATMVNELRLRASRDPERLSIADLTAIASVGARAHTLIAYTCQEAGGPVGASLAAARQWRRVQQHLASFKTPSRGRDLAVLAHRFRGLADPLIRHSDHILFRDPAWQPAVEAMARDLAQLGLSVTRAINGKLTAGHLLVPFDSHTRGREHLYAAAKPDNEHVALLQEAVAGTHSTAGELATSLGAVPNGDRRARAPRRPHPGPTEKRATTNRTPPPPPPQAPRAPHR